MAVARSVGETSKTASVGVNCSSKCVTKDHKSFGECMRSKNLHLDPRINDERSKRSRSWDSELDHYESAVRQGLEPTGTSRARVDQAIREADAA